MPAVGYVELPSEVEIGLGVGLPVRVAVGDDVGVGVYPLTALSAIETGVEEVGTLPRVTVGIAPMYRPVRVFLIE